MVAVLCGTTVLATNPPSSGLLAHLSTIPTVVALMEESACREVDGDGRAKFK